MPQLQSTDLHELQLLEHVERSPQLSNRVAAGKLGVSVKLAHQLLKGMVERGLLHVRKENSRRWEYFLTPRGLSEKARLTFDFLEFSMAFYREARRRSAQVCRDLSERGIRTVALLGAGDLAEIVYLGVQEWGLVVVEVFSDDRAGRPFMGVDAQPLSAMEQGRAEAVIVCVYDRRAPMGRAFLPAGVRRTERMHWVFPEVAEAGPAASGGARQTSTARRTAAEAATGNSSG